MAGDDHGMTLTEKVLARAAGRDRVGPGDEIWARVDLAVMHDSTGPRRIAPLLEQVGGRVWDKDRIVLAMDHFAPAANVHHAEILALTRSWARAHGIRHFYDSEGISHNIMLEEGLVRPGMMVVGADSHTVTAGAYGAVAVGVGATEIAMIAATGEMWVTVPATVRVQFDGSLPKFVTARDLSMAVLGRLKADFALDKAVEFGGSAIRSLSPEDRSVLTNQAVEMGAHNGIIAPDDVLLDMLDERDQAPLLDLRETDASDCYEEVYAFDAATVVPLVARPPAVDKVAPASQLADVSIDRAYLGSCAGAKHSDMAMMAEILRGRSVKVPLTVVPATRRAYRRALEDGTIATLVAAGATVQTPGCGACAGLHSGVLAAGERIIASVTRNFPGRMGHESAEIFLASPYTVAASAVTGKITDPSALGKEGDDR